MEDDKLSKDAEFEQINRLYDECLNYLKNYQEIKTTDKEKKYSFISNDDFEDPDYEVIKEETKDIKPKVINNVGNCMTHNGFYEPKMDFIVENELKPEHSQSVSSLKSDRLRKLSQQLPKIIITQSNTSLDLKEGNTKLEDLVAASGYGRRSPTHR